MLIMLSTVDEVCNISTMKQLQGTKYFTSDLKKLQIIDYSKITSCHLVCNDIFWQLHWKLRSKHLHLARHL